MIVKNITKGSVITGNLKIAGSPIDKFLGLLKKSNPRSLLFKTRFGIHTLFLKKPIDIIVVDHEYIVRKLNTTKPNRLFFYNPKYPYVIELPAGSIKSSQTQIGDRLEVINS